MPFFLTLYPIATTTRIIICYCAYVVWLICYLVKGGILKGNEKQTHLKDRVPFMNAATTHKLR